MRQFISKSLLQFGLLIFLVLLSSTSYAAPLGISKGGNNQTSKTKKEVRLNKQLNKLSAKLDKAKNTHKKQRLNKKIKKVKQKQENKKTRYSTVSFVLALIALGLAPFAIFLAFTIPMFYVLLVFLILGILAIVFGILSLERHRKNLSEFKENKKLAIAGIIMGGIVTFGAILLMALIGSEMFEVLSIF